MPCILSLLGLGCRALANAETLNRLPLRSCGPLRFPVPCILSLNSLPLKCRGPLRRNLGLGCRALANGETLNRLPLRNRGPLHFPVQCMLSLIGLGRRALASGETLDRLPLQKRRPLRLQTPAVQLLFKRPSPHLGLRCDTVAFMGRGEDLRAPPL